MAAEERFGFAAKMRLAACSPNCALAPQKVMMPPHSAANDVSPLALRNDAAPFGRNDAMFVLCARRHTSLP